MTTIETPTLKTAADEMANALQAYFNKRGSAHSERKGNEDIAALADALANYGYAENIQAANTAHLRDQLATAHEAIGAALALVRQQSYGAAEIVLEHALKGKPMPPPEPKPDPPKDNDPLPDPGPGGPGVPGDERD